jgi:hypothetical protein
VPILLPFFIIGKADSTTTDAVGDARDDEGIASADLLKKDHHYSV